MQKTSLFCAAVLFMLSSCKNETTTTAATTAAATTTTSPAAAAAPAPAASLEEDTKQLTELAKGMYTWLNTTEIVGDFWADPATEEGENVKGLDLKKHQQKIKLLKMAGFFSPTFIDNYDKIGMSIHKQLADGKMEWTMGDMAPFEGVDPWTRSQDTPNEYWKNIKLDKVSINNNVASFVWVVEGLGEYQTKAEKEAGVWKIAYLEGFDEKQYLSK